MEENKKNTNYEYVDLSGIAHFFILLHLEEIDDNVRFHITIILSLQELLVRVLEKTFTL